MAKRALIQICRGLFVSSLILLPSAFLMPSAFPIAAQELKKVRIGYPSLGFRQ